MEPGRHLAFFFPTFTPGGIERVMITLSREFLSRGIEVDILVADRRGPFENRIPEEARIVDLEAGRVARSLFPVRNYLQHRQPDVLLSGHTHANLVCVWAALLSETDVTTAVGVHTMESAKKRQGIKSRLIRRMVPATYRRADRIIAVSEGTAADASAITSLPRDRISVIRNPVSRPSDDQSTDVHPWITADDRRVILGAGRLSPAKDFSTLVRAFKRVHEADASARLVILGEGDERPALERLVSQLEIEAYVDLPGYVDDPSPYMAGSNVFVLSSRREGFGLVLVEAMAVGTPVVSTDCPTGPDEILAYGEFGRLVPVGNPRAMANAILETMDDPESHEVLKQRTRAFDPEVVADEYLATLYDD